MAYSIIEQEFEHQCHTIHPDIDPNIFLKEYNYYEQRIPLLRKTFTELHQHIHDKLPNVEFTFTARLKAKKSFLDKKIKKMAENIETIFHNDKLGTKEYEPLIKAYLNFLPPEKFEELKNQIVMFGSSNVGTLKCFAFIFEQLSYKEKSTFIKSLARTEDTFAYSISVKSVSYPINEFAISEDGSIGIIEKSNNNKKSGKTHSINCSVKFNPETDIIEKSTGIKYIYVDNKEYPLNLEYLVYPTELPKSERNLKNALRDANGMLTLLQDSISFKNGLSLPVESITYDKNMNCYFLITPQGERINLTNRLAKENLILKKFDELTCESAIHDIRRHIEKFYQQNSFYSFLNRRKNYIKNPKMNKNQEVYYKAFHDSAENTLYKYMIEGQLRSFLNKLLYSDESTDMGHNFYKQREAEKRKNNPILAKILEENPLSFDSSTPTLMRLLEDNPDIDIMDLMGSYFVTTTFPNGKSDTYLLEPEMTFMHIFGNQSPSSYNPTHLDFSSYANFIASRVAYSMGSIDNNDIEL